MYDKLKLLERLCGSSSHEFQVDFRKSFGSLYRSERDAIIDLLQDRLEESPLRIAVLALRAGLAQLGGVGNLLEEQWGLARLTVNKEDMVASLIHMHVNRALISEWQEQELVIYDLLRRSYQSQLAQMSR